MIIYQSENNEFDPATLTRSESTQFEYTAHLNAIENEGIKPSEYIISTVFTSPLKTIAISRNQFGYELPHGYTHMLLWFRKNSIPYPSEFLCSLIKDSFIKNSVKIIWQNEKNLQSIKDLAHLHFIVENDHI